MAGEAKAGANECIIASSGVLVVVANNRPLVPFPVE